MGGEFFDGAFEALTGSTPFGWQRRLFKEYFLHGEIPAVLDIPTGLGKTSVIVVWLVALAQQAESGSVCLPRRLVYVVNRRTVVDQATDIAEGLRRTLKDATPDFLAAQINAGLSKLCIKPSDDASPLAISTLRGERADNREWQADPVRPAIIIGTVDMIGSRLLFSGYGVSNNERPYHAGFLGADTLVVLDEAHLVPPFEALLKAIARDPNRTFQSCGSDEHRIIPRFRLMSLSATGGGNADGGDVFRLIDADYRESVVKQRLSATKRLTLVEAGDPKALVGELVKRAWALGTNPRAARVLVYCNSRGDALEVKNEIDKRAKKENISVASELLVGERRMREREKLFGWLKEHGFIGDTRGEPQVPTFLVATSAGEVGVDMDADHMVCDLVEWERIVQRLGRVNRRGGDDRVATVDIVAAPLKPAKKDGEKWQDRLARLRKPIDALNGDGSPAAVVALKNNRALKDMLQSAQTPAPLRPALTRALVDAWSLTSLKEHTGRPEIQPWLRGWVEDDAQTTVVWRTFLPVKTGDARVTKEEINDFFESAPPSVSESLEAATWSVVNWLIARAAKLEENLEDFQSSNGLTEQTPLVFILDHKNEVVGDPSTLGALAKLGDKGNKEEKEDFLRRATGRTLVVSSLLGGLNSDGMLAEEFDGTPSTMDADETWEPARPFRVREVIEASAGAEKEWKETYRFVVAQSEGGEPIRWLVVEERRGQAQSEVGRAVATAPQLLTDHRSWVEEILADWARKLNLPEPYANVLKLAGRLHDEGKRARRWQRAFNAPRDEIYAKTRGPINQKLLDGYRHELGSLLYMERDPELKTLPPDLQELALHIVAAHHGGARPLISIRSCEDAPPSALEACAREVALRFARLQKRWGPWGLAWWEALLRAADRQASRENDAGNNLGGEPRKPAEDK